MDDMSSNVGWMLSGFLFGLLALIVAFFADKAADDSAGRLKAVLKGLFVQFVVLAILMAVGGV